MKYLQVKQDEKSSCLFVFLVYRPAGAYGVPAQYERSFRWKLMQFRNLCRVCNIALFVFMERYE
jgi:hypothetical protein